MHYGLSEKSEWIRKFGYLCIHPRNFGNQVTVHPRARPRVHPHHGHINKK